MPPVAGSVSRLEVIFRVADITFLPLATFGAVLAVSGSVVGAILLLASIAVRIASHLVVGLVAYRRIMASPWPDVRPLDDEDW